MARTILVVDDDPDYLDQMVLHLQTAGYEVLQAESAAKAKEIIAEQKPDLAVIDLMLEEVDAGFSLCYHIKKIDASLPVVMVTAVASETGLDFGAATDEEKLWVKADAVLDKPVRYEQLQREITRLLKD